MNFTNSPLVSYIKLSPNHSGQRVHCIDRFTPHCVVGQLSVETLGLIFQPVKKQASCTYGIGADGRIGMYCEEKNRSWCTSSGQNDQRAITVECACDPNFPWTFKQIVFDRLVELLIDCCKRNGKTKVIWIGDKTTALAYQPKTNEIQLTMHRWFAAKACPGDWLISHMQELADLANKALAQIPPEKEDHLHGTQATILKTLTEYKVIEKMGPLFTADQKATGILASVSMAQFLLESGYGKSELAQNANNMFGMKKSLSGNAWAGSTWDGKSVYTKRTQEQSPDGQWTTITADFRKYCCMEDGIADHSAYLLGAKNGTKLRYAGLKGCTDYRKAAQIIKDGGYATAVEYVNRLVHLIESHKLYRFDLTAQEPQTDLYRVRKTWNDTNSQLGAFSILENAKNTADAHEGYAVFDSKGNQVYPEKKDAYIEYTVEKGDSLWLIAEKFLHDGSRYNEIKVFNGMVTNNIYPDQILKIPNAEKTPEPEPWKPAVDDKVKIQAGATWYKGQKISNWVINKTWIISSLSGDRAVLGKSTDGLNNIQSPINTKFLTEGK